MTTKLSQSLVGLHRFGLGLRPGDLALIGENARDLLRDEVVAKVAPMPTGLELAGLPQIGAAFYAFEDGERARRSAPAPAMGGDTMAPAPAAPAAPAAPPLPQRVYREETLARVQAGLKPVGGFAERLAQFWSNHFCVSAAKSGFLRATAGAFEREAIRPHVFGRFEDMLLAVESHPAMLAYLDNALSVGPNSPAGKRRGRGLNENLAREILELHTMGVSGGYTQADVTSLARIITGWTVAGREGTLGLPGVFAFNFNVHEPGAHDLLGKTYASPGAERGRAALLDIARHPATGRFIALKLARHFVADSPPPALVDTLAGVFERTRGDLAAVAAALIGADAAWLAPAEKLRSPQEFMLAAARALGRPPEYGQIAAPLAAMGQPMWQPAGPNGFPDAVAAWGTAEGVHARIDVSAQWGRRAAGAGVDPRALAEVVLGPILSTETREAVARAESRAQGLAILLMSPEFQRR